MVSDDWAREELARIARRLYEVRRALRHAPDFSARPRARVLEILRRRGPSTVATLAADLKLSRAVVKTTLLRLRPQVEQAIMGRGRGHGTVWRVTQ